MKTLSHILVILMLLTGATSCRLGQKYVRPDLDIPQSLILTQGDSASLAEMKWWEVYSDTLLQNLINEALTHNRDILESAERLEQMAALKGVADASMLPELRGQAYAQKEALNYGGDNYKNDPEMGVKFTASWEVDLWGRLRWQRSEAVAQLTASAEDRRALTVSIIAEVADGYFRLMALDSELHIVRQTLEARRESMRLAQLRFQGGLTSEMPWQQAKVEYSRTATHLPMIEQEIRQAENRLSFLTGRYPGGIRRSHYGESLDTAVVVPDALSSLLLQRRPDLRAAEQRLIAANASVGVAYTDRFPRLALTATGGVESEHLSDLLKSPMYFLMGDLAGPILDFGRRKGRYKAAQAAWRAECYSYESDVLGAFREVSDALSAFDKSRSSLKAMKELERSAAAATQLAALQYINGVTAYLDLLDAQRQWFDARIGVIKARRDRSLAIVSLYRSLGGGF